jgi:type VI secretion system protein ImpH
VQYDRPEADRFSVYVGALLGLGTPALRHRDALPDNLKLYFSGLLACQTRHADGLRQLLAEFLQLPVRLDEFVGRWINLPPECWCLLGRRPAAGTLGVSAILGYRAWDCSQTFRLVFGPIGLEQFLRLLPGGESLERVTAAVRNYVADELGWEVKLVLRREEVPPINLGEQGQLGWTTWLACDVRDQDAEDLILRPLPEAA